MKAEIHQLRPKPVAINWQCSSCGVDAGCNCGAPLMSKGQQAKEKLIEDPSRSDQSIAAELGMSQPGVSKVRHKLEADNQLSPAENRIGKDGKSYRMPVRAEVTEDSPSEVRKAFLFYSHEARLLARYDGPIDDDVLESAMQTAAAWQQLITNMQENANG